MARHDEWCDLCDEKPKTHQVKLSRRKCWVCVDCVHLVLTDLSKLESKEG